MSERTHKTRHIAAILFDGALMLDLVGPIEVFNFATLEGRAQTGGAARAADYEVEYLGVSRGPFETSIGLPVEAARSFEEYSGTPDLILVPGQVRGDRRYRDAALFSWLRKQADAGARIMSVCSGAYVLAEAGLLEGRAITTHWAHAAEIRNAHPAVNVVENRLFCRDGDVFSSGGVTSGIDLALSIIEEDCGVEIARRVAKRMVVHLRRQGDQAQFSDWLGLQDRGGRFDPAIDWVERHLDSAVDVQTLADLCAMSPRNFARQFGQRYGITPMAYVQKRRLSFAKDMLETSQASIAKIAEKTGFSSDVQLRRAFQRIYHITPTQHREQFGLKA